MSSEQGSDKVVADGRSKIQGSRRDPRPWSQEMCGPFGPTSRRVFSLFSYHSKATSSGEISQLEQSWVLILRLAAKGWRCTQSRALVLLKALRALLLGTQRAFERPVPRSSLESALPLHAMMQGSRSWLAQPRGRFLNSWSSPSCSNSPLVRTEFVHTSIS